MRKHVIKASTDYPQEIQRGIAICNAVTATIQGSKIVPEYSNLKWNRINYCQAWWTDIAGYYIVRSYRTAVAFEYNGVLYSLGRYSNTTYQHIRKYRNNYADLGYETQEVNLGLVDWY